MGASSDDELMSKRPRSHLKRASDSAKEIKKLQKKNRRYRLLIDALLLQNKKLKSTIKRKKYKYNEIGKEDNATEKDTDNYNATEKDTDNYNAAGKDKNDHNGISTNRVSQGIEFKANSSIEEFVQYATAANGFNPAQPTEFTLKNPLKQYIETNLNKIVKYIMGQLNRLSSVQVCSSLYLLSPNIHYLHKSVIAHDVVVELADKGRIPCIFSALFHSKPLQKDPLSSALNQILSVEVEKSLAVCEDPEIRDYLNHIKISFILCKDDNSKGENNINSKDENNINGRINGNIDSSRIKDLNGHSIIRSTLETLVQTKVRLICDNKISSLAIRQGFCIRVLCSYLGWEETFKDIILDRLFPLIKNENRPEHIYYLGILAINALIHTEDSKEDALIHTEGSKVDALAYTGGDKNICTVIRWFKEFLKDGKRKGQIESGIAAYLILKQVSEVDAGLWLNSHRNRLVSEGYDIDYLGKFLLI